MTMHPTPDAAPLQNGLAALERGAWHVAVESLTAAAMADDADASAWEALGIAHGWLQQTDEAVEARQNAYSLYRERGDDASAARLSLELANDFFEGRGEHAVANGWFQRARRLLDGLPPSKEHALLRIWDAYMALMGDDDPVAAEVHAAEAASLAMQAGAADTGALALALQGLARVSEGRVTDGMHLLDEALAAATGGEFTDPQWFHLTCCCMIDACDRVRDFRRSLEWCHRLREYCERWQVQAFLTTCRIKFTGALMWQGDWERCEAELKRALAELSEYRPSGVAAAIVRLAELRRRQGRREEAEALLRDADSHPLALPVRATLALDAGDATAALELAELSLRSTPSVARTQRLPALELKARAHAQLGNIDEAAAAAAEMAAVAEAIDTKPIRAASLLVSGVVAYAAADHEAARRLFEDAILLLAAAGSVPESARARLELAVCLAALGRTADAAAEAAAALFSLENTGAMVEAQRARALLDRLADGGEQGEQGDGGDGGDEAGRAAGRRGPDQKGLLTRRQCEVLALVAEGLSDREIAERLFLSEHTVHRHVANILGRLGASTRTTAVVRALDADLI